MKTGREHRPSQCCNGF